MPITVTHPFTSTKPDNPSDIASGKVTPSRWNASHSITGAFSGSEITNVPAGAVTATNSQAAINQLASLIPAPGPGTDPLFLTKGLSVSCAPPNDVSGGNPTNRYSANFGMVSDYSDNDPLFGNVETLNITMLATRGQNTNGPRTQAKASFIPINLQATYNASGQKFALANQVIGYGMGDTAIWAQNYLQYAGGPVNGDEGQGWGTVSTCQQQPHLTPPTQITSVPAQSTVNTVTTQPIVPSQFAQTVTVANTAGAVIGDWVIIEQELPRGDPNLEPVQIISFTANSITGIFLYFHAAGVTVTPALRLFVGSSYQMGQDRVLINLSQPSYSTGLVTSIVGGGFIGAGTNWTIGMVGGNATNIGAVTLAADDYHNGPFSGASGPLRSWYQIDQVASPTDIGIFKFTVAGAGDYVGKGPGTGVYEIRPAARVLRIIAPNGAYTGEIICETSTSTWALGDNVEQAICPYPDVFGFQYAIGAWTPGGQYRAFMDIHNCGSRTFQTGILFGSGFFFTGATADTLEWNQIISLQANASVGINIVQTYDAAIQLYAPGFTGAAPTDIGGSIIWGNVSANPCLIGPDSNVSALKMNTIFGGDDGTHQGTLAFAAGGKPGNISGTLPQMKWYGLIYLPVTNTHTASLNIANVADETNFERAFMRWEANVLAIGTEKGAAGTARDLILKTDNTEQLRLVAGSKIQFSSAPSFSANDTVATALTNVGPIGSHTTVQTWLTIVDNLGATRYIPCF